MPDKREQLGALVSEWGACQRCGLGSTRRHLVFGSGDPRSEILLIGEAPGKDENFEGRPFVGEAGHFLNHILKQAGMDRNQFYITNTVCCRPSVDDKDRKPSKTEIEACWPRLERLIYIVDPVIVVACGKVSVNLFQRVTNMKYAVKDLFKLTINGKRGPVEYPGMTMYHPSFLERRAHAVDLFHSTVDQLRHLNRTLKAFHELGRDRPYKEEVA